MCARLKVQVSSRHNGPAFIAVSTSSMAEKAVPISAAEVSVPGFGIRFNDMRLEIERWNCCPSIEIVRVDEGRPNGPASQFRYLLSQSENTEAALEWISCLWERMV